MDYIKEVFESIYGLKDINSQAIVTGKTNEQGGLKSHQIATGSAIYYIIKNLAENKQFEGLRKKHQLDSKLENQRVIMIGFGEMGRSAALFLHEKGVKIVGIQEFDGCAFNRNGINIPEFSQHYKKYHCMLDYVDYLADDEQLLDRECDILVLAT